MTYQLLVTCAIIKKGGKFLLTQRPKDGRHNAGRWEFPGGKVDFGEDPRECLKREIHEEMNIVVEAKGVVDYSSHVYDKEKHVVLIGFICDFISGEINKKDIEDYKWVTPQEMGDYDITEADLPFVERLKSL